MAFTAKDFWSNTWLGLAFIILLGLSNTFGISNFFSFIPIGFGGILSVGQVVLYGLLLQAADYILKTWIKM